MTKQEILEKAKPILFNTEMVRAILDGRKTVTRRVVKPQMELPEGEFRYDGVQDGFHALELLSGGDEPTERYFTCGKPFAVGGDYLYVRETYGDYGGRTAYYTYKADYPIGATGYWFEKEKINWCDLPKWKPSIHMPKEAARIFLKVTSVRVERLQEITDEQARAEGMGSPSYPLIQFKDLWRELYDFKDNCSWDLNPWVWVIEFEKVKVKGINDNGKDINYTCSGR